MDIYGDTAIKVNVRAVGTMQECDASVGEGGEREGGRERGREREKEREQEEWRERESV